MGEHPRPLETEHPQILYLDVCPPFLHLANSHRERKLGVVLEDSEICAFIMEFVCFCFRFFSPSIWLRSPVVHWGNAQNNSIRSLGKAPKSFLQVLKIASGVSTNQSGDWAISLVRFKPEAAWSSETLALNQKFLRVNFKWEYKLNLHVSLKF